MQDQNKFDIPIRVDLKWSPTRWGKAKKLECEHCTGIGTVYPYSEAQITELLFNHEWDVLDKMKGITCSTCEGLGYETEKIYEHRSKLTQQIQKELVTV